jgi:uncharacterized protein with ParB-like and HNH nuclease domain
MREDEVIEIIDDEKNDDYSDDSLYSITSWGADLSFRELTTQYKDGDLLKPELQRKYVWDKSEASRFIDSILLGLPIPSIFLAKAPREKMLIIDGYQRIMTVNDYINGIFSTDKKVFQLTNSEKINKRWRGKAFAELSETDQRKIRATTIHCIIFKQEEPKDNDTSMFQVFERINTSGRTLLPQEIRNCVYQGEFNSLLFEINEDVNWRQLYGLESVDSRMRDMEFILRFLALKSQEFKKIKTKQISLKKFLNQFMGAAHSQETKVLETRKKDFLETIGFIHQHIGVDAFHNVSQTAGKFNPTIFDSIMIATSNFLSHKKHSEVTEMGLAERRKALLNDQGYQELIRIRTTTVERIKARIDLASRYLFGVSHEEQSS